MILADVNVLIGAFRTDGARHDVCKPWLDKVIIGDAPFGVSPLVLSAVIRITTGRGAFNSASPIESAFGFCDNLLSQPHCHVVEPGNRHWDIFKRLCIEEDIKGIRVTDAWYAALAIEHGCTWITLDRDFARFPDLDWRLPAL